MTFFTNGWFSSFFNTGLTLCTSFNGQVLIGLGGNDKLTSKHNFTTLFGLGGNDTLTTTLNYSSNYVEDIYAFQFGGTGSDAMTVNINGYSNYIGTILGGGSGADQISVKTALANTDPRFDTQIENLILSDEGADNVNVHAMLAGTAGEIQNEVYAGIDNDVVNLRAEIVNGTGPSTAYNYAEGGDGDDVMTAYVSGAAKGSILGNELRGDAGNDILTATVAPGVEGGNYLYGGSGNDTLTVIGGNYNELYAGSGNDTLIGSMAIDFMVGGTGADRFVFGLNGNDDIITDFATGSDKLVLTNGQTVGSLSADASGTLVTFGDGASVFLEGVTITDQAQLFA